MKLFTTALVVASFSVIATAQAAPQHNLGVTITPPAGVHVYEFGTYQVRVANTGTRNATGVTLSIALPRTATSPQVFVMGNLANVDSRCALSGQTLNCSLGQLNRNGGATTVTFDLKLPYSTGPLGLTMTANPIAGDSAPSNNTLAFTATPAVYATAITGPVSMQHDHCTGSPTLTSFFECTLFPSSISGFTATYNADHTITIPGEPDYSGAWSQTGGNDRLQMTISDLSGPVGSIDARGVDGGCFEGRMIFTGNPNYVAPYRICP